MRSFPCSIVIEGPIVFRVQLKTRCSNTTHIHVNTLVNNPKSEVPQTSSTRVSLITPTPTLPHRRHLPIPEAPPSSTPPAKQQQTPLRVACQAPFAYLLPCSTYRKHAPRMPTFPPRRLSPDLPTGIRIEEVVSRENLGRVPACACPAFARWPDGGSGV